MSEGSSGEVREEEQKGRRGSVAKGRSCKGYLYYSSTLKSNDKHLRCVGIPRSLPQDSLDLPQHQNHRPTPNRTPTPATATNTENGFVTRFTRNANLVASGVMKNLKRVGNFVKDHFDDSLDGYRKPPK